MLKGIAMDVRNSPEFHELFVADPQILGVDAIKGSEVVFPVVFKTRATKQYAPVREFRRRVRLALEENRLLPGHPYRVFNPAPGSASAIEKEPPPEPPAADSTAAAAPQSNPFAAE
jgi:small conductance mechanosensitive channel